MLKHWKRAMMMFVVALAVSLMFGMIHMVPGDPATVMLGPKATPELKADFSRRMGLDQPLPSSGIFHLIF